MHVLTDWALLCGPGLPARLFFEMDGVLISSRFFLVNIFRVPLPSIPTSLSFTYSPPTHPPTRHLGALPLALSSGCSVPSRPTFSHDECLSVFLLPLSHIEPRRLTDRDTDSSPQTVRSRHPLRSACACAPFPPRGGWRRRDTRVKQQLFTQFFGG